MFTTLFKVTCSIAHLIKRVLFQADLEGLLPTHDCGTGCDAAVSFQLVGYSVHCSMHENRCHSLQHSEALVCLVSQTFLVYLIQRLPSSHLSPTVTPRLTVNLQWKRPGYSLPHRGLKSNKRLGSGSYVLNVVAEMESSAECLA